MKLVALIFLSSFTLTAPAYAQTAQQDNETIVVTGRSLEATKRDLEACIARKCPTLEDIAATLAYAETAFVDGGYHEARAALKSSLGRNRGAAAQYPKEVAGLYRANARVSAHLGEGEDYRSSTWGSVRALKKGLDDEDIAVLSSLLDAAQMHVRLGEFESADKVYADAARQAEKAGHRAVAATARLRRAWLSYQRFHSEGSLDELRSIAASQEAETRTPRLVAMVLLARIDRAEGGTETTDQLVQALAQAGLDEPTLLWAPPIDVARNGHTGLSIPRTTDLEPDRSFDGVWADVGFWVRPDGSVEEPEVLRSSGDTDWIAPVLRSIGGRAYSPSQDDGSYRVERYSYTSLMIDRSDTRIRQHAPGGRIEYLDLTDKAQTSRPGNR